MQSKVISIFTYSAGGLFLAVGAAMLISNGIGAGFVPPHDPLFGISIQVLFWTVGAAELSVGLVCLLLCNQAWVKINMILWLAMNNLLYGIGFLWTAGPRSFNGYWGNLSEAFHVAPSKVLWMMVFLFGYLFSGSIVSLLFLRVRKFPKGGERYLKNTCVYCGGRVEFPIGGIGRRIGCPHCMTTVTLCKPPGKLA